MTADPCLAGKAGAALPLEDARGRALAAAKPLREQETLPLDVALGRVLAQAIRADADLPPFDSAAMDGYAIHVDDLSGGTLRVVGRTIAGDPPGPTIQTGTAHRIMTGAPTPPGAAAVVMQERAARFGDSIRLEASILLGANIRRRGEDMGLGGEALSAGLRLTPARLALLAGCGVVQVPVLRRLRVALLSTGNELVEPGQILGPGQIYNTNRVMLRALLTESWIALRDLGILPDDPVLIRTALREAAAISDVVISSGGVSAGEEDHVLDALRREDATLEVLKVAIRPGKPLTIGRVGRALYIGLPGNPYAAAVTFTQIARPALWRTAGLAREPDLWIPSVAGFDYKRSTGRTEFVPVTWSERDGLGRPVLHHLGFGASAKLQPVAQAQGLAVIPSDMVEVRAGTPLAMEPLGS